MRTQLHGGELVGIATVQDDFAPRSRNARAISRPIPLDEPVTITVLELLDMTCSPIKEGLSVQGRTKSAP